MNNGDCGQRCMNTAGGYDCHCHSGYELNPDERTCDGKVTYCLIFIMTII